ncbi:hypothetical protein Ddye_000203 [Dipteronia dyeriana]|uniref:Uncharacterized protein n=1 Tax=Dipteronia dyeriana TaxID=168575 RepID=A0AAE0CSD9_9ROSI|nr:hypothetical protein Ddye_000203 [Dipteronia dyeriana]
MMSSKFGYQRLRHGGGGGGGEDDDDDGRDQRVVMKSRNWFRFRRVHIRRRFRLKLPVLRKKVRLVSAVRFSCAKVLKRLKESQAHFGDLFAGNYLFLQVNPTSLKCIENLQALPSNYSLPRVV